MLIRGNFFHSMVKWQLARRILWNSSGEQKMQNKKESRLWDSPPAADRISDIIPLRRSAILAERFYFIGYTFLWNKKIAETLYI